MGKEVTPKKHLRHTAKTKLGMLTAAQEELFRSVLNASEASKMWMLVSKDENLRSMPLGSVVKVIQNEHHNATQMMTDELWAKAWATMPRISPSSRAEGLKAQVDILQFPEIVTRAIYFGNLDSSFRNAGVSSSLSLEEFVKLANRVDPKWLPGEMKSAFRDSTVPNSSTHITLDVAIGLLSTKLTEIPLLKAATVFDTDETALFEMCSDAKKLRALFDSIDVDHSGEISLAEAANYVGTSFPRLNRKYIFERAFTSVTDQCAGLIEDETGRYHIDMLTTANKEKKSDTPIQTTTATNEVASEPLGTATLGRRHLREFLITLFCYCKVCYYRITVYNNRTSLYSGFRSFLCSCFLI